MKKSAVALSIWFLGAVSVAACGSDSVFDAIESGSVDRLQLVLSGGANPNRKDWRLRTPMELALSAKRADMVVVLLEHGADPDTRIDDWDAFFVLASQGEACTPESIRAFVRHGRGASERGYVGVTPLHVALASGSISCARVLLDLGADVNATDDILRTPLMEAAESAPLDVVSTLLSRGAAANAADVQGRTPLMFAAARRRDDPEAAAVIRLLLAAGGDPCVRARDQLRLADIARLAGSRERVEMLKDACSASAEDRVRENEYAP